MLWLQEKLGEECMNVNLDGRIASEEFACMYPFFGRSYSDFELGVCKNLERIFFWEVAHPYLSYFFAAIYAFSVYYGKKYMANRKPLNWRNTMAVWNLFLSLYSLLIVFRVGLPVLHYLTSESIRDMISVGVRRKYGINSTGFYLMTFVWSKYFELFDTFFIIIHKKPLILLHWYHHISVLLFTWDSQVQEAPAAPIFSAMNAAVHFIMYGYYFLISIRYKGKWMSPMFITIAQIAQMVVGTSVSLLSLYYYVTDKSAGRMTEITLHNVLSGFLMYGSYLGLFVHFFVNKYIFKNQKASFAGKKVN